MLIAVAFSLGILVGGVTAVWLWDRVYPREIAWVWPPPQEKATRPPNHPPDVLY